jgi:DNA-binding NarL/FixJ family response regulator
MSSIVAVHGGKGPDAFARQRQRNPVRPSIQARSLARKIRKRIFLADPHPLFRYGLKHLVTLQPDLECAGEADTAQSIWKLLSLGEPDLLIMAIRFPDCDGIALIKALRIKYPGLRILVSSAVDESVYAERAFRAGAVGFAGKETMPEQVVAAIRCVLAGDHYFSRKVSLLFLRQAMQRQNFRRTGDFGVLSDRELSVFELLGVGLSSRKVAIRLGISLKTVESHRENIKHKLGLGDGAELVHRAVEFVEHS